MAIVPKAAEVDCMFLEALTNVKRTHASSPPTSLFLTDEQKGFLATCMLNVSFVTANSYDRARWFASCLRQEASGSTDLDLALMVTDGKISVCEESFLPLLLKSLKQLESELRWKDISFKFGFEGLCARLADLVTLGKMPDANLAQYLFSGLGERRMAL